MEQSARRKAFRKITFVSVTTLLITLVFLAVIIVVAELPISPTGIVVTVIITVLYVCLILFLMYRCYIWSKKEGIKVDNEALAIVEAFCGDVDVVYYADFELNVIKLLKIGESLVTYGGEKYKTRQTFERYVRDYSDRFINQEDKKEFLEEVNPDNFMQQLKDKDYFTYIFLANIEGKQTYYQLKAVKVGNTPKCMVIGLMNVDNEIRANEEKKKIMKQALIDVEKANKTKTEFLANMSHDLRTPLNAIMGFTAMADWHYEEADKVKEYISKINTAANQMLYLVDTILDVNVVESGELKLHETDDSLTEIISDLEMVISSEAKLRKIEFSVDTSKVLNEGIICDKARLNRAMMNLLGNALQYTDAGGKVSLSVSEIAFGADESTYQFVVKDNGIGMSPEYQRHIFDMFSREKSTTECGISGVGLGMTITKKIIDLMGGNIEVKSVKGEGSEFTVTVPFKRSNKPAYAKAGNVSKSVAPARAVKAPGANSAYRILVVEDNELNRDILLNILEENGYLAESAENGKVGLDMFTESEPGYYSLILMDIRMPVMDGHSCAVNIRKLQREDASTVPIIAISANAFSDDAAEARQSGMNEHLAKPIKAEKLKLVLSKYLN